MKKVILSITIALFLFSGCATLVTTKQQAPKFTTIEQMLKLEKGMSFSKVVSTLGSNPYDLYKLSWDEDQTVYVWYYQKIERKEEPSVLKTKAGMTSGDEVIDKQQMLYVTFDDSGKLVKAITDSGKGVEAKGNTGATETTEETKPFWQIW